jgi:hypothetical protein
MDEYADKFKAWLDSNDVSAETMGRWLDVGAKEVEMIAMGYNRPTNEIARKIDLVTWGGVPVGLLWYRP